MRPFSVCVFCGARPGSDPAYVDEARALGAMLAREEMRLVYGAGDVGVMGAVAQAVIAAGGDALGVIPTHLVEAEAAKRDLRLLIETQTMHERKKVMFVNSDAVVLLPGGAGSLDEFFEGLTWSQLGIHSKPIIIVNTNGYWTKLIDLIDHLIEEGFASPSLKRYFSVVTDAYEALDLLRELRSA